MRNWKTRIQNSTGRPRANGSSQIGQLQELARRAGIMTSYLDTSQRPQEASPATLRAILALWDIPAGNPREVEASLRENILKHWRQGLAPVSVAWNGRPLKMELRLPSRLEKAKMKCVVRLEDGHTRVVASAPDRLRTLRRANVEGSEEFVAKQLALPDLPWGYHLLEVEAGGSACRALLISAPKRSWWPSGRSRDLGSFLPLYSMHSERSWGAGNLSDLSRLADWFGSLGGNVVSTLPMLGAFLGAPVFEPSPYSPISRLFWNGFYIDVESVPEFAACGAARKLAGSAAFQRQLEEFRRASLVDYRAQMSARRTVIERMARFFFTHASARRRGLERFLDERPDAVDYARFRAVCEKTGAPWRKWPERLRSGELKPGDYAESVMNYHLYVQWIAHEQMAGFRKHCARQNVRFYLDLPLGVHGDGYDCWREQEAFAASASAGAPPDSFFSKGQNWGFPPLHPERLRSSGYGYVREYLAFHARHCDLLRIDHVMGLHRLYWIPAGFPPSHGAYVSYRPEELYAILSLESHRHQTGLVGENLGTVPPEVNTAMARHALRQTYVVQYQQSPGPGPALSAPPKQSVASLNTHDMPTFTAHWQGLDIEDRLELGLIQAKQRPQKLAERKKLNNALARFLQSKGWLQEATADGPSVLRACLKWLGAGPAEVVLVNLEDLWDETEPQNVPGTSAERPNWRRTARLTLEEIQRSAPLRELLGQFAKIRRPRDTRRA
jgi:4-alpha-glucanotransferase